MTAGQNGLYSVPFEWTMGGDWVVQVTAKLKDGGTATQQFKFTVGEAGMATAEVTGSEEATELVVTISIGNSGSGAGTTPTVETSGTPTSAAAQPAASMTPIAPLQAPTARPSNTPIPTMAPMLMPTARPAPTEIPLPTVGGVSGGTP